MAREAGLECSAHVFALAQVKMNVTPDRAAQYKEALKERFEAMFLMYTGWKMKKEGLLRQKDARDATEPKPAGPWDYPKGCRLTWTNK